MLAVDVGLKLPHCALPQVTVQFTVALGGPFVMVTAMLAVALVPKEAGGVKPEVNARLIFDVIVMVAETVALPEVAVMVTVPPDGTVVGAV